MRMIVSVKYAVITLVVITGGLAIAPVFETDHHRGPAAVIDADTLQINDTRYRLYGVDAVEANQMCRKPDRTPWPCGQQAIDALSDLLRGREVVCEAWQGDHRDADDRQLAICHAGAEDLAEWLVKNGWAVADPDANRLYNYTAAERTAKFLGKGIWSGGFDLPQDWRVTRTGKE
ncbi:thermonuclease family protein [Thalassospira lucentensis]|uniref:thermonuclease family protein n=1 Tax=Thalassospira lucentensis TaxID=168935 RepID=UPI0003B7437A|nr:thermonuclease family protein [Thalassospira lucentensis]